MSPVLFSSGSVHWRTPHSIFCELDREFDFNMDPCPLRSKVNGLSKKAVWAGRRAFCNPPYGKGVEKWLERGLEADIAVFLLPARTDTKWFHAIALPHAREIRFMRGRLHFDDGKGRAPFPSMVVVFKKD